MAARQGVSIRKAKSKNPNTKYKAVRTRYTYRKIGKTNSGKNKVQRYSYKRKTISKRNAKRKYSYR